MAYDHRITISLSDCIKTATLGSSLLLENCMKHLFVFGTYLFLFLLSVELVKKWYCSYTSCLEKNKERYSTSAANLKKMGCMHLYYPWE